MGRGAYVCFLSNKKHNLIFLYKSKKGNQKRCQPLNYILQSILSLFCSLRRLRPGWAGVLAAVGSDFTHFFITELRVGSWGLWWPWQVQRARDPRRRRDLNQETHCLGGAGQTGLAEHRTKEGVPEDSVSKGSGRKPVPTSSPQPHPQSCRSDRPCFLLSPLPLAR